MEYDIHIQIVNYNTKQYLVDCIEGILRDLKKSHFTFKISVLDNNSSDDLSDLEPKYKSFNINFYKSSINLGFGGGHNELSKKEKSKYLLILNPDIKFLEDNTISRLYRQLNSNSKIKVIGPRMISDNRNEIIVDHGELHGLKAWSSYNLGNAYWRKRTKETYCAWTCGAFFLVEKLAFDNVDGFDETFFLFVEEEDLCLRIRKNKGKILYYPQVTVFHYSSVVAKKSLHYEKSHEYYIQKHFAYTYTHKFLKIIRRVYRKTFNISEKQIN